MSAQQLSVVAVGDRFVPSATLAQAFSTRAKKSGLRATIEEIDLPYPSADSIPLPAEEGKPIRAFWEDRASIEARLAADESDPDLREYTGPIDGLMADVADADVLLLHTAPLSRSVIEQARRLRVVGSVRTGPVNVNVAALSARNIPLFHTPGRNASAVAEFIAGALLAHIRSIASATMDLREGRWSLAPWSGHAGMELNGKCCGLVGFGQVGRAFAPIANGLGMVVRVYDPYVDAATVAAAGAEPVTSLPVLLGSSDVVVLAARLNSQNRHMIDEAAFARMKPTGVLVNTARADLVDAVALADALTTGRLAGAVIDVLDHEPPLQNHPLLAAPNVLLTPHIAGATRDTVNRGAELLADSVIGYLSRGEYVNCLNGSQMADAGRRED